MRRFFLYLSFFFSIAVYAQDECAYYQKYINKGNTHLENQQFREAINSYSIALVHCPAKTNETWELIMVAFQKIEELKDLALANEIKAIENEKAAKSAKLLSDAYKFIFFAQEAVKNDPMLALHLADTSLKILDSVKTIDKNDSSIYEKALRIYYENNFGETLIDKTGVSSVKGNLTQAIYAPDGKSIWTLTDSACAYQWNLSGNLMTSMNLDTALNVYGFKESGEGKIVIHGFNDKERYPSGKIWELSKKESFLKIPENMASAIPPEKRDSITLNPKRDSSAGWVNRIFAFGDRAFQVTNDFKLIPVINDAHNSIRHVAFSPNGNSIATSDIGRVVKVKNLKGEGDYSINTGINPIGITFSPDNKIIAVNNSVAVILYENKSTGNRESQYLNISGLSIQSLKFSKDGKMLLLSFSNRYQQVSRLYKKNTQNWKFTLYAEFKCPGAFSTSTVFSTNFAGLLSSSDKVRIWKIPAEKTQPSPKMSGPFMDSLFIISVDHTQQQNEINGYSLSGKKMKFNTDGSKITAAYADTTYQSDSVTSSITAFLPGIKKAVIVSENGDLNMFHEKQPMEAYLKNFRFEPFTEAQKRKYGIK